MFSMVSRRCASNPVIRITRDGATSQDMNDVVMLLCCYVVMLLFPAYVIK